MARLLARVGSRSRIVNPTPWPACSTSCSDGVDDRTRGQRARDRGNRPADRARHQRRQATRRARRHGARARRAEARDRSSRAERRAAGRRRDAHDIDRVRDRRAGVRPGVVLGLEITPRDRAGALRARSSPTPADFASATRRRAATPSRGSCSRRASIRRRCTGASTRRCRWAPAPAARCARLTLEVDPSATASSWISLAGRRARATTASQSEDLDGIAEHPRSIAGTRLALFFRDLGHGKVKVSFRSTGDVDVNRFARQFGGGGHAKAAGALIPGSLDDVRERVVEGGARVRLRNASDTAGT